MQALKNAKHEHFAQLVSNGENAKSAYVLAGFSPNGAKQAAAKLLTRADLTDRIADLRKQKEAKHAEAVSKVFEKAAVDKAWVLDNLTKIVGMGMAAEAVLDNEGKPVGEYKANLAAANKALELVGKELGMFIDRKEVRTGALDELPREHLKALLSELDSAIAAHGSRPAAVVAGQTTH